MNKSRSPHFPWLTHSLFPVLVALALFFLLFLSVSPGLEQRNFVNAFAFFFIGRISGFFLLGYVLTLVINIQKIRKLDAIKGLSFLLKSIAITTVVVSLLTIVDLLMVLLTIA